MILTPTSSEIKAILSVGFTSIQSFPIRTTGQLLLHSCLHFLGLHCESKREDCQNTEERKTSHLSMTLNQKQVREREKKKATLPHLIGGDNGNTSELLLVSIGSLLLLRHLDKN